MKSAAPGRNILAVEVRNVSVHGFWLLVADREVFLSFEHFPWFRDATIGQLTNVELPSSHPLYWPDLDIDLAVESMDHPERFPLVSRTRPNKEKEAMPRVRKRRTRYTSKRRGG